MAKWYQRHMGDYLSATRHLTFLQHGVYTLLLDYYYATERPIPADLNKIAHIFGVKKESERQAFQEVLTEFFSLTDDGWRNRKADSELAKMHQISERRSKAGHRGAMTTNRNKSASAEQLPVSSGAAANPAIADLPPADDSGNCSANGSAKEAVTIASASAIELQGQDLLSSKKPLDDPAPVDNSIKARRAAARKIGSSVLEHLNARCGTKFATAGKPADAHLQHIVARILDDGADEKQLRDVVNAKAFEWGTDENMRKYLRPATLFNRTNYANYVGQLVVAQATTAYIPPKPKTVKVIRLQEGTERTVTEYDVTGAITLETFPWKDAATRAWQQNRKFIEQHGNTTLIVEFAGERRTFKTTEL